MNLFENTADASSIRSSMDKKAAELLDIDTEAAKQLREASSKRYAQTIDSLDSTLKEKIKNLSGDSWDELVRTKIGNKSIGNTYDKAIIEIKNPKKVDVSTNKVDVSVQSKATSALEDVKTKLKGLGLKESDLSKLQAIGSSFNTSGLNARSLLSDQGFVSRLRGVDATKVGNLFSTLPTVNKNVIGKEFKKGFTDVAKEIRKTYSTTDTSMGITYKVGLTSALSDLQDNAKLLSKTFKTDQGLFSNLIKKDKRGNYALEDKNIAKARKFFKDYHWESLNVKTNKYTDTQLRQLENVFTSLDSFFKRKEFPELRKERSGLEVNRRSISDARSLRSRAKSRWDEFGALMAQNTAFMGSYAVIGGAQAAIGGTLNFFANFSDSMKNLQAITGDTTAGLKIMSDSVKQVSTTTKFSAIEISQAATILGQAGFSAIDISKSLNGIVELATGTGSKLEDATQVLTSTLTIWDKSMSESKKVANEFTAAINKSKLDISSLTSAIQYTGNIAAAADIPYTDVLTMTSLLKDAGIKRGSTLGTGQRLLYSDLMSPSKRFIKSLEAAEIDLSKFSQALTDDGVLGALTLMKESGYGLAEASRGMEMREKSIYLAAINQLDKADIFRSGITGTNAAFTANKTQMEGIGNKFKNMMNSWQINLNKSLEGASSGIGKLLDQLTVEQPKKDLTKNLGNKNYTMDQASMPDNSRNIGIAAAIGGALLGLKGKSLISSFNTEIDIAKKAVLSSKEQVAKFGKAGYPISQYTRTLSKMPSGGVGMGSLLALGGLAYTALSAEPDNRIADTTATLGNMGMAAAAYNMPEKFRNRQIARNNRLPEKMRKDISPLTGNQKMISGMIAATVAQTLGSTLLEPELRKGGATGALAGAAEFGIPALLTGNIPLAMGAAVAGGVAGYFSGDKPKKTDLSEGVAKIVNDAKVLSTEAIAIGKLSESIGAQNNYALKPSINASNEEKMIKFRATVEAATQVNDSVKTLEKTLSSHAKTFSKFNFGSTLATNTRDNIFNGNIAIKVFDAKGTDITVKNMLYKGTAQNALAYSLFTAQEAAYNASNAKGGINDTLLSRVKGLDTEKLKSNLSEQTSIEARKAKFESTVTSPILDLLKNNPELATGKKKELLDIYDKLANTARKADVSDTILTDTYEEEFRAQEDAYLKNSKAKIEASLKTAAISSKTLQGVLASAKGALGCLTPSKFVTTEEGKVYQDRNLSLARGTSFVKSLLDRLSAQKNSVRDLESNALKLTRGFGDTMANSINKIVFNQGKTLTFGALDITNSLIKAFTALDHSVKKSTSIFGDISTVASEDYLKRKEKATILNTDKFPEAVKSGKDTRLLKEPDQILNITKVDREAISQASEQILNSYTKAEDLAASFIKSLTSLNSVSEARATGDQKIYTLYKDLNLKFKDVGIKNMAAFNYLREAPRTRSELSDINIANIMSPEKYQKLQDNKQLALENLEIRSLNADKLRVLNFDFKVQELNLGESRQLDKLNRNMEYSQERLDIKTTRAFEDLSRKTGWAIEDAYIGYNRSIANIQHNYSKALDKIYLNKERGLEDIALKGARSRENISISMTRGLEDLSIRQSNSLEDLGIKLNRGIEDINIKTKQGLIDLATKQSRANSDLQLSFSRKQEDLQRGQTRAIQDLFTAQNKQWDKIGKKLSRGLEDIATARARGYEDLSISKVRGTEDIGIRQARAFESLTINTNRAIEKLTLKRTRILEDTNKKLARNIENVNTNFQRNIDAIQLQYVRTLASIDRARSDTIMLFNRSLNKPQNITLDPKALDIIANQLGDTSLALDSHKAALDANTTAVQQNNAIQKSQENIAKAAYKSAYKKVGGQVYNDDGTVNDDFTKQYQLYMDKNSSSLIDTVLENALNKSFSGVGFDISKALTDASYIANQVSTPSPGMTTAGAFAGTGLSNDQAAQALYGIKADQVRITTTTGVLLEAQGGMEGALYDLDTAMINFDIKIREAGISLNNSLADAGRQLNYAMSDLTLNFQRSLEDINLNFKRGMEDINISTVRASEDIALSTSRAFENLELSLGRAAENLELKLTRATEDLYLSVARAREDIAISINTAITDLNIRINRSNEDLALARARAMADLNTNFARAGSDFELSISRARDNLNLGIERATENLNLALARANESLSLSLTRAGEDLSLSLARAGEDLGLAFSRQLEDAAIGLANAMDQARLNLAYALDNIALSESRQAENIMINYERAMTDLSTSYEHNVTELNIAVDESLATMQRGFAQATKIKDTQLQNAKDKIDRGFDEALKSWASAASNWSIKVTSQLSSSLAQQQLDTAGFLAKIQQQLNNALRGKLLIDGELIVRQVKNSFHAAITSSQMQLTTKYFGDEVGKIFYQAFTGTKDSLKQITEKLDAAIKRNFVDRLGNSLTSTSNKLETSSIAFKTAIDKLGSTDVSKLPAVGKAAAEFVKAIEPVSKDLETVGSSLSKAAASIGKGSNELAATTGVVEKTGAMLKGLGIVIKTGSDSLSNDIASSAGQLANSFGIAGQAISFMAKQAIAQISRATKAATGHSTGGFLSGYGGGDIIPIMAEPGEFILRKEIVRSLGVAKLNEINAGRDHLQVSTVYGVPDAVGNSITVNLSVNADNSIDNIQQNIEFIADGVKRVFEEYS